MSAEEKTIRRWTVVAVVYSLFYSAITVISFANSKNEVLSWVVLAVTLLFWLGTIFAVKGQYSAARVFMLIGGIAALPLGILMIMAGNRIRRAANIQEGEVHPVGTTVAPLGL